MKCNKECNSSSHCEYMAGLNDDGCISLSNLAAQARLRRKIEQDEKRRVFSSLRELNNNGFRNTAFENIKKYIGDGYNVEVEVVLCSSFPDVIYDVWLTATRNDNSFSFPTGESCWGNKPDITSYEAVINEEKNENM